MLKPHLACDAILEKVRYPTIVMPKYDGVRALHLNGKFTGRSLKPHDNIHLTKFFDQDIFKNLDGELTMGPIDDGETCRRTTSGVNTINGPKGEEFIWWIFDCLDIDFDPYHYRYTRAEERVAKLQALGFHNVKMMPHIYCDNPEAVLDMHIQHMSKGLEGTIIRDPWGAYKSGRSTAREAAFLRIKDFVEEEAYVLAIEEGEENMNEAKRNELGYIERSSHKENKVPNGMVGRLICKDYKTGDTITVAPGRMTHQEREFYFKNPNELIGKLVKYKTMAYGKKDLPRFPTFQCIRPLSDM